MFGFKLRAAQQKAITAAADHKSTLAGIEALSASGNPVPDAMIKSFKESSQKLHASKIELGAARGEIIPSIQHLFVKMANVVGIKGVSGKATTEYAEKTIGLAAEGRAGIIQRSISKPIRFLAKYPKLALVGTTLLAVVGIGNAMHKRAERQTEANTSGQMADLQARLDQMAPAQANTMVYPVAAPAASPLPDQGSPMNMASPMIQGGQYQGRVNTPQLAQAI